MGITYQYAKHALEAADNGMWGRWGGGGGGGKGGRHPMTRVLVLQDPADMYSSMGSC